MIIYKCTKCGWDDKGTGDTAHVCGPVSIKGYKPHEVQLARLTKKLNKMRDQRDKARADLEHHKKVLSMQPHLETRYKNYTEMVAERQRVKDLEARVKEQAKLIELLQKPPLTLHMPDPYGPPYRVTC
jgi:uncharacterized coiled-coil protein SlyX